MSRGRQGSGGHGGINMVAVDLCEVQVPELLDVYVQHLLVLAWKRKKERKKESK